MDFTVTQAQVFHFSNPDEVWTFPKGTLEILIIEGAIIGRATYEPGWKWSTSVQPLAKTKSCEVSHFKYLISGTLKILLDDGLEFTCKAGDVCIIPSGHDAWVVGDETVVAVDFQGMADYNGKFSHTFLF